MRFLREFTWCQQLKLLNYFNSKFKRLHVNRKLCSILLTACAVTSLACAAQSERPNVLLILTDDLGYQDLSCQGATDIQTPHIDRLAAAGIRFDTGVVP